MGWGGGRKCSEGVRAKGVHVRIRALVRLADKRIYVFCFCAFFIHVCVLSVVYASLIVHVSLDVCV
jgi:hypothetical protein